MITLIVGSNQYMCRLAVQKIKQDFTQKNGASGIERYDGDDLQPAQWRELLQGVTLFSAAKLVIIREASANKTAWEALDEYLDNVPDDTHLVLVETAPDRRLRTYKHLQKVATIIACDPLDERALSSWLVQKSDQRLSPAVAQFLLQRVGTDQMTLANELEKVLLHSGDITQELITEVTSSNAEGNAFAVLDATLAGDQQVIVDNVRLLRASEDAYRLFGLIVSQIYTLVQVWGRADESPDQIAKSIGAHPFVVRKLRAQAQRLTRQQVHGLVTAMADLDTRLKSSPLDPWDVLLQGLRAMAQRT